MSGGSFDYAYQRMAQFAAELDNRLDEAGSNDGNPVWSDDVASRLRATAALAYMAEALAKEAEWLYSGDTGEDTFLKRARALEVQFGALQALTHLSVVQRALTEAHLLCTEVLPKFNWGASPLDANAITQLNETPKLIAQALGLFNLYGEHPG